MHNNILKDADLSVAISRRVSQAIKKERLEKDLTLEAVAKGICSLSYLSKIENHSLVPHPTYLQALCEKLDIDFEKICLSEPMVNLDECLNWYLYDVNENITEAYESIIDEYYNANDALIKTIYYLSNNYYELAFKELSFIGDLKNSLSSKEFNVYTLLVAIYYSKTYQYDKISQYLELLVNLSEHDKTLKMLYYEQVFFAAYHKQKHCIMHKAYCYLTDNKLIGYPMWRLYLVKLMMLEVQSREGFPRSLKDLDVMWLENNGMDNNNDNLYYKLLIFINSCQYQKVFDILDNMIIDDGRILGLYAYCAHKLSKFTNEEVDRKIKDYNFLPFESVHKAFIQYLTFKHQNVKRYELCVMLKNHVLPLNENCPFPLYTNFFLDEIHDLGLKLPFLKLVNAYY